MYWQADILRYNMATKLPAYNKIIGLKATSFIVVSNIQAKKAVNSQLHKVTSIIIAVITIG